MEIYPSWICVILTGIWRQRSGVSDQYNNVYSFIKKPPRKSVQLAPCHFLNIIVLHVNYQGPLTPINETVNENWRANQSVCQSAVCTRKKMTSMLRKNKIKNWRSVWGIRLSLSHFDASLFKKWLFCSFLRTVRFVAEACWRARYLVAVGNGWAGGSGELVPLAGRLRPLIGRRLITGVAPRREADTFARLWESA